MEDVKVREMQIFDYKKKIAEAETKLKQQQVRLGYWRSSKPSPVRVFKKYFETISLDCSITFVRFLVLPEIRRENRRTYVQHLVIAVSLF